MKRKVLLYSLIFVMMLVFSRATFEVNSFGVGFYMALVFMDFNAFLLSPMLMLSEFLFAYKGASFVASGICVAAHIAYTLAFKDKKKLYPAFAALSLLGYAITSLKYGNVVDMILTLSLAAFFAFVCYCFIKPLKYHRLKYKLLDAEVVCGAIMLIAFGLGLASIQIGGFCPLGAGIALAVCVAGKCMGNSVALVTGISMGLGGAIYGYAPQTLALYCFLTAILILFLPAPPLLAAPTAVAAYAIFVFYFDMQGENALLSLLSVFIGGAVYAFLPRKVLGIVTDFFGAPKNRTALRFMVNKNRRDMGNDLIKVSEIFAEMSATMLNTTISEKKLSKIKDAVTESVCSNCPNREICVNQGILDEIDKVIECSMADDRGNIINAAPGLGEHCINIVALITQVNELLVRYEGLKRKTDCMNMAKTVVSSQLKGMSEVLKELSVKQSVPIGYIEELERRIMDELTYRGIFVGEVWVKEDGEMIIVCLKNSLKEETIKKTLKKAFKRDFILKTEDCYMPGWAVVTVKPAPVYDAVFSSCNNGNADSSCGDTHSFIKLSDGRFMAALCDGMGSGREARDFSSRALSLIENFYRAGFEHGMVLDSANRFFTLTGEETYGAMDIVVVDLNNLTTDIIKIGSPAVYIKNTEKLVKIEGSSLPIGVLDEMKPSIKTITLRPGDTVVMTSDGVADCFAGDDLAKLINESSGLPKELTTTVLNAAGNMRVAHGDDMTVLAFRIFKRE